MMGDIWFNAIKIIEDERLVKEGEPVEVKRSWFDRLFSWPWEPWIATETVIPMVPDDGIYQFEGDTFIMHPATAKLVRERMRMEDWH